MIYLRTSDCLSVCRSIYLCTYLPTYLPTFRSILPTYLSIYIYIYISLSLSLSLCLPTYLPTYLPIYLFIYLSIVRRIAVEPLQKSQIRAKYGADDEASLSIVPECEADGLEFKAVGVSGLRNSREIDALAESTALECN